MKFRNAQESDVVVVVVMVVVVVVPVGMTWVAVGVRWEENYVR
jgi:hypothetical protein